MSEMTQARREERGVALVVVLLILAALTLPAVSLLVASRTVMNTVAVDRASIECLNVADSGVVEGLANVVPTLNARLQAGIFYDESPQVVTSGTVDHGGRLVSYDVSAVGSPSGALADVFDQELIFTASCASSTGGFVPVRVKGFPEPGSAFGQAFCSCTDINVNGSFSSDSYDSTLGDYASQSPGSNGNLAANDDIDINGSSPNIAGTVLAGGNIDASGSPQVTGGSTSGGSNDLGGAASVDPAPSPCDCSSYDVVLETARVEVSNDNDAMGDCQGHLSGTDFDTNHSCTLAAGRYYLTSLRVRGSAEIQLAGPVELYLDGSGPFSIGGGGIVNGSATPADLQIFSASDEDIRWSGGPTISAYLYAPEAELVTSGNVDLFGAMVVGEITANGGVSYHYDESGAPGEHLVVGFALDEWRAF